MCLNFLMAYTLEMSQLYFLSFVYLFWRNVHWLSELFLIYEYIVSILYLKRFLYILKMKSSHIHVIFKYSLSDIVNLFLLFTVSIVLKLFSLLYMLISAFISWGLYFILWLNEFTVNISILKIRSYIFLDTLLFQISPFNTLF